MMRTKHILVYLAIGSFSILSGCAKTDEPMPPAPQPPEPTPPVELVPIRLKTQLVSRAIIDNFDSTALYIAKGSSAVQYDELWEAVATGSEIRFVPERYYPADSSAVYLTGFYPKAPVSDGLVEFTLDGQTDIIVAGVQTGSIVMPFDGQNEPLEFRHQLALLKIVVSLAKNRPETYYLKSFGLDGSSNLARLDLSSGKMLFGEEAPQLVVYEAEGEEDGLEISAKKVFTENVLVQPRTELTVDLVLAKDNNPKHDLVYTGLPVHFDGSGSEGNVAYTVDIVIGSPDLPIKPDTPDEPDKPVDPDTPDTPDEPDSPVDPDEPVAPVDPPLAITITATVSKWDEIPGGDLDFTPSQKND